MSFENATARPWKVNFDSDFDLLKIIAADDGKPGQRVVCEGDDTERTQHDFELMVLSVNTRDRLMNAAQAAVHALRSYEYGNSAPALAQEVVAALEAALKLARGDQ